MTASNIVFANATTSTAQFGNTGERGYREHAEVTVLAYNEWNYLVVCKVDQKIGIATMRHRLNEDSVKGVYYCTNARDVSNPNWSVERSLDSLGYGDVDADLVRQYL